MEALERMQTFTRIMSGLWGINCIGQTWFVCSVTPELAGGPDISI